MTASARADRTAFTQARRGCTRAVAALGAVVASFGSVYALCSWCGALPNPAIIAAIVAIGLSRRPSPAVSLGAVRAPIATAGIALAAAGVGWLFRTDVVLGAIAFTAGIAGSIWLRNFGRLGRTAGALIALPLMTMLVVPARAAAPGGPLVDLGLVAAAGIVPLAIVAAVQHFAARAGIAVIPSDGLGGESIERRPRGGMPPPTRMALQMAVALSAAFSIGFSAYPAHWGWVVLTTFIVGSGARGRGDVLYKGVLRLAGALTGTLAAALLTHAWAPTGLAEAATIFAVLFVGLWLRDINYAFWAGCMTLILALLAGPDGGHNIGMLGLRLQAIVVGALCAAAAAWFVFPIRTEAVVRRRIADALVALDDLMVHADGSDAERAVRFARFERCMTELERIAAPVQWHRRIFRLTADGPEHPARWIELTRSLCDDARGLGSAGACGAERRATLRRAIGASRRALGSRAKPDGTLDALSVSVSLRKVREALTTVTNPPRETVV